MIFCGTFAFFLQRLLEQAASVPEDDPIGLSSAECPYRSMQKRARLRRIKLRAAKRARMLVIFLIQIMLNVVD